MRVGTRILLQRSTWLLDPGRLPLLATQRRLDRGGLALRPARLLCRPFHLLLMKLLPRRSGWRPMLGRRCLQGLGGCLGSSGLHGGPLWAAAALRPLFRLG
jgi:hypothetical protein